MLPVECSMMLSRHELTAIDFICTTGCPTIVVIPSQIPSIPVRGLVAVACMLQSPMTLNLSLYLIFSFRMCGTASGGHSISSPSIAGFLYLLPMMNNL